MKKFVFEGNDGTRLTVKRSRQRAVITVNDGWHDIVVVLAGDQLEQLCQTLALALASEDSA